MIGIHTGDVNSRIWCSSSVKKKNPCLANSLAPVWAGDDPALFMLVCLSETFAEAPLIMLSAVPARCRGAAWDGQHTREEQRG